MMLKARPRHWEASAILSCKNSEHKPYCKLSKGVVSGLHGALGRTFLNGGDDSSETVGGDERMKKGGIEKKDDTFGVCVLCFVLFVLMMIDDTRKEVRDKCSGVSSMMLIGAFRILLLPCATSKNGGLRNLNSKNESS
jgi:hypothetical protein